MAPVLPIPLVLAVFGIPEPVAPALWDAMTACHQAHVTSLVFALTKASRGGSTLGGKLRQILHRTSPQTWCEVIEHCVVEHGLERRIASLAEEGILWCTQYDGNWT